MPINILNGVHVHPHSDHVLLVGVKLSSLRMCATPLRWVSAFAFFFVKRKKLQEGSKTGSN